MIGMSEAELSRHDIAEINLHCAVGLPGSEDLDITQCLERLQHWTEHARFATERALENKSKFPQYRDWPDGIYRALMLQIAIQNHLGMKLDHARMAQPFDGRDSRDLFIHSVLMDGRPAMCTTAPVIYAAIGRSLGYPIRLVKTKCHIFCRWDDPNGERFNIEPSNPGFLSKPDSYYRDWPLPWTPLEQRKNCWLKSLTVRQELALSLDLRGTCWFENMESENAMACFSTAWQLDNSDHDVEQRWAMVTLLHPALMQLRSYSISDSSQPVTVTLPRERKEWEERCYPAAKDWLDRMIRNRRTLHSAKLAQTSDKQIITLV